MWRLTPLMVFKDEKRTSSSFPGAFLFPSPLPYFTLLPFVGTAAFVFPFFLFSFPLFLSFSLFSIFSPFFLSSLSPFLFFFFSPLLLFFFSLSL
jgi:hypothetical protein